MRKIIFRAWDKSDKKMIFDIYPATNGDVAGEYNGRFCLRLPSERIVLEQYSGVNDKFGTLIFEGDIVQYECGTKAEVIFKEGCFVAYDGYANSSDEAYMKICPEYNPIDGLEFDIQVIGNIHEMSIL